MAYSETPFPGKDTLRTILQLVRYDIPPLIVGKSSIGKSYTIIELTKKWRITNSLLYIGSEKVENIEGLAKLISGDYDKDEAGSDILKFLKPYWFPNTKTITEQVKSGRKIFSNYVKNYYDTREFQYNYDILHQILLGLMDVEYVENETEVSVQLIDMGDKNLSDVVEPVMLNTKPFTFKRTLDTVLQVETANEGTLPPTKAGFDEVKNMCMYLTTILGYGNYWLILDELDKVSKFEQDKYAPLLHIVRERTLKNWTMKEVNDKEGLNVPESIQNEDYDKVVKLVNGTLDRGLPVTDARVIGIANATINIESALFRRFCQIIMEDTMSLTETKSAEVNAIKNCIKDNVGEQQMDITDLMNNVRMLDEVNLQWQYSFLPKILNQGDRFGNYFYKNFSNYYNRILRDRGDVSNTWGAIQSDPYRFENTSFGKVWKDNFIGNKDIEGNPAMEDKFGGLFTLWGCLVEQEFNPGAIKEDVAIAGFSQTGGGSMSPLEQERSLLQEEYTELGDNFWVQLNNDLIEEYGETIGNPSALNNWTNKVLFKVKAANINSKGEYDQLPGVGSKILPFVYGVMMRAYRHDEQLDSDLFTQQIATINKFFTDLLNKDGDTGKHPLKFDAAECQKLMQGVENEKVFGVSKKEQKVLGGNSLYGFPANNLLSFGTHYGDSLSFALYMRFYFPNEWLKFSATTLSSLKSFNEFMDDVKKKKFGADKVYAFLHLPKVRDYIKRLYDSTPKTKMNAMNVGFIKKLMKF